MLRGLAILVIGLVAGGLVTVLVLTALVAIDLATGWDMKEVAGGAPFVGLVVACHIWSR